MRPRCRPRHSRMIKSGILIAMTSLRRFHLAFPMPTVPVLTLLFATFLCTPACSLFGDPDGAPQKLTFLPVNISIKAEVAGTELARQKGLMHRTHLGEREGMLFPFDQLGFHSFYMYNTRIPLSVIFLDEDLRIVDIQDMAPCLEEQPSACTVYTPRAACKYAIEVNQEFVRKYQIKVGDLAKLQK